MKGRIPNKEHCSILDGLCPRIGKPCEECTLMIAFCELKPLSRALEAEDRGREIQTCGECQHFEHVVIGGNGAVIGECVKHYKKNFIYASSRACKKLLYKGGE